MADEPNESAAVIWLLDQLVNSSPARSAEIVLATVTRRKSRNKKRAGAGSRSSTTYSSLTPHEN
jgi:hypothetical protein